MAIAAIPLGVSLATATAAQADGPCDIYAAGGTPCQAAHSTTRALYAAYNGPLYQVKRASDSTTLNIAPLTPGGVANAAAQDAFCANTTCTITTIYDQSGNGNNLTDAPAGGAAGGPDTLSNATAAPVLVGGHKAYGVFIAAGGGYRDDATHGIATGDNSEGEYAIFDGTHFNNGCCFDYGNAETNNDDDGNGTMEAIYFGTETTWGTGSGSGPWVMADLENGLFSGVNTGLNSGDPTVNDRFLTAMIEGGQNQWAILGGNAQSGTVSTFWNGVRPTVGGYNPMKKQGAIILGIGGDNSKGSAGTFYEGVLTSGYPTQATENLVQANIVSAQYDVLPTFTLPTLTTFTPNQAQTVTESFTNPGAQPVTNVQLGLSTTATGWTVTPVGSTSFASVGGGQTVTASFNVVTTATGSATFTGTATYLDPSGVAESATSTGSVTSVAPVSVNVDTAHPTHAVSPKLFGDFFEEINYGGEGGLYAEEIRDRAFNDPTDPSVAPVPRVAGKFNNALQLNGTNQYVSLPTSAANAIHGLTNFSISVWVNPAVTTTWQRIFDFGTGTNDYMFLTVSAGSGPRFAITVGGNAAGAEQQLSRNTQLPTNTWSNIVVTLSGTTGTMYLNGVVVATNTAMNVNPSMLPVTTQTWLGRSQYADPYLNGKLDDFQIYNRALTQAEVTTLANATSSTVLSGNILNYKFDEAGGANVPDSSGNGYDGTLISPGGYWSLINDGAATGAGDQLDSTTPLNSTLTSSLQLNVPTLAPGQRVAMANSGYFGIPVAPSTTYNVSFWAKASPGFSGPLTVSLEGTNESPVFATANVSGLTSSWVKYTTTLTVPAGVTPSSTNVFTIGVDNRNGSTPLAGGTVWLDVVSVFPPTYNNEPNGLRPDLVNMIAALHPKFLRFPGGNFVEGNYLSTNPWRDAWLALATVGPVEQRAGHDNSAWGYWDDDGLGLDEFLRLSEDLGAIPIVGVFDGLSLGTPAGSANVMTATQLAPYVQDALNEIQYMIGPVTSTYGAMRAANGHPAPYPTPEIEIGNEDNLNNGTASYNAYRYPMFYDAIKAAYPQIKLIATTAVTSRPMDILDEHFYETESFFEANSHMFDNTSRTGPEIDVLEYADRSGTNPATGSLDRALGDAVWMTGLERNSDIIGSASYAPLFNYVGHEQWDPDLIGFNQQTAVASPDYWVQSMFANNLGDQSLNATSSSSAIYTSSTLKSSSGVSYTEIVNPANAAVPMTITIAGSNASTAQLQVLASTNATAQDTLAAPNTVVPVSSSITGANGVFSYTAPANSLTVVSTCCAVSTTTGVSSTVASTLALSIGGTSPSFGTFTPGVAATYTTTTTANVISSAQTAALTVSDPDTVNTGHLVNGSYVLASPLQVKASSPLGSGGPLANVGGSASPTTVLSYNAPVSNDPVTVTFSQQIGATDPLRTGAYSKALTFTLSTTQP